jgi:CheY-like chemotaxis protein
MTMLRRVLLVEDDPGDRLLIQEVLAEHLAGAAVDTVVDGSEALDHLYRRGDRSAATRPDLILLDLNLPKVDGRAVLEQIKSDEALAPIPVIVLTTSNIEEDIARTYAAYANAYVPKPIEWDGLSATVQRVGQFYFETARLPGAAP